MSEIKSIIKALHTSSEAMIEVGPRQLNAMKRYMNNANREFRAMRDVFNLQLRAQGPHPLDGEFQADSKKWVEKLCYTKDGGWRDNIDTRKLGRGERYVLDNLDEFQFVCMHDHTPAEAAHGERQWKRGHEKASYYPLFRAVADDGSFFEYINLPWQAAYQGDTGLLIVTPSAAPLPHKDFVAGYLEAAFFTDINEDSDESIRDKAIIDIHPACMRAIESECIDFARANWETIQEAFQTLGSYGWTEAGRDLWFTRNGHGVGFWDRNIGPAGDKLSDSARAFGSRDMYAGDDGRVYFSGQEPKRKEAA